MPGGRIFSADKDYEVVKGLHHSGGDNVSDPEKFRRNPGATSSKSSSKMILEEEWEKFELLLEG